MNKVLRIISVALLGVAATAMFLFWTPCINGHSPAQLVLGKSEIRYTLGALLLVSGILCFRSFGFRNRRVLRIVYGAIAIGLIVAAKMFEGKTLTFGQVTVYWEYLILGGGYVVLFLLLFIMHLTELGSRKGLSKIFSPFTDLVFMVFAFVLYVQLAVPLVDHVGFYQYIVLGQQYGHYACGGFLALTFVFAFIELFTRKSALN